MKTLIDRLFGAHQPTDTQAALSQQQLQLASAALLIEVATIDQHFDDSELQHLQQLLVSECKLTDEAVGTLIAEARQASAKSASLYEFTRKINDHCQDAQKRQLMKNLWGVAYADGTLDKYEEHIIRRIADLLHIRHADFIRAKQQARDKS
ncbi:MAG: TerB family tellurite resistance protein [Cellvibrionaceae bacterium]|nr:TerB family tellurite resistance protein [Cellvibrionaceae bacterium]